MGETPPPFLPKKSQVFSDKEILDSLFFFASPNSRIVFWTLCNLPPHFPLNQSGSWCDVARLLGNLLHPLPRRLLTPQQKPNNVTKVESTKPTHFFRPRSSWTQKENLNIRRFLFRDTREISGSPTDENASAPLIRSPSQRSPSQTQPESPPVDL